MFIFMGRSIGQQSDVYSTLARVLYNQFLNTSVDKLIPTFQSRRVLQSKLSSRYN